MKSAPTSATRREAPPAGFLEGLFILFGRIPDSLILFGARLFPAAVFWMSGRTKMEGWEIAERTYVLFEHEYALPVIDPELAARLATISEHLFPVLLVLGIATRFSALALLGMTAVIQVFVYPQAWPTHGLWAVCFLLVIAKGPGVFALDHLIRARFAGRA
jgi:putative oxidoreductase